MQNEPFAGLSEWGRDHERRIAWWREARFGMFVHWGLYSGAGGRWKGKDYEQPYAEWIQNWAAVPSAEYSDDLKPHFKPAKDAAKQWATLAHEAGMKYAVLTAKHHEGFTLFNSKQPYSLHNEVTGSTNISPDGRDLVGEFCEEFRKQHLRVGLYYSLLDWQHPDAYDISLPISRPAGDNAKYVSYMHAHVDELLSKYGKVDLLWFDFSTAHVQGEKWAAKSLLQSVRRRQSHILINNRLWDGLENKNADICTPEKYVPATGIPGMDWETNHTLNESYGFSYHDNKWKSAKDIIRLLAEIVSKGGNLLLNIGPDATGKVPEQAEATLQGVGKWMKVNGDAIYGTTASPFPSLPWGVCTQKPGKLFLHVFDWPKDGRLRLPFAGKVRRAYIISRPNDDLPTTDGLTIHVPVKAGDDADTVIVVETKA